MADEDPIDFSERGTPLEITVRPPGTLPPPDFRDFGEALEAVPEEEPRAMLPDIAIGAVRGVRNAAQQVTDLTRRAARAVDKEFPLGSILIEEDPDATLGFKITHEPGPGDPLRLPRPPMTETVAGDVVEGVSRFLSGFLGVGRVAGALSQPVTRAGQITQAAGIGAIAEQAVFDPNEPRLSNLIQQYPMTSNPVTEFLAANPDDPESLGRFKMALEGTGLGVLTDTFVAAVRRVKTNRASDVQPVAEIPMTPKQAADEARVTGDKAGNINLDFINSTDDVKVALREISDANEDFIGARRGVISNDETRRLADTLGMTQETLMLRRKGQAFNAEEAFAARSLLVRSGENLVDLATAARGGSDEALVAFQEGMAKHTLVQEQVSALTAEAGRALQQFQITAATDAGRTRAIKTIIEGSGGRERIEDIADMISKANDPSAINRIVRDAESATTADMFLEVWINSLLSGPQTHAVNTLSNSLVALWTIPEHLLATGVNRVLGGDKMFAGEVLARTFGLAQGARDGLKAFSKTALTGEPSDLMSKIELPRGASIPGPLGAIIRTPGRMLMAEDEFFKAVGYRQELNTLAYRQASEEGLKGRDFTVRVSEIIANPPEALSVQAFDAARYQTFTKPLGRFGQAAQAMQQAHPAVRVIMPFIRTPTNIVKFAAERSPLPLLSKEMRDTIRAGGPEGAKALSRIIMGSGVGAMVASLAAEGKITGAGPSDPGALSMKRTTGWQPYSIRIGDEYVSYSRLEPLGMLFGISADMAEISGQVGEKELDELAVMVTGSIAKNLTSKTWLKGLSDVIEAFDDPDRFGERYIQRLVGTLVPTGVAQVNRTQFDPMLRDVRSTLDAIKSRIPHLSQQLPPRNNLWGEPIVLGGGFGPDIISPFYSSTLKNDPVSEEMVRLELAPRLPQRQIFGIELDPHQYSEFVQRSGRPAKAVLDLIVTGQISNKEAENLRAKMKVNITPGWQNMPDFAKREAIEGVIRGMRNLARVSMMAAHPELLLQLPEQMRAKLGIETAEPVQ